MNGNMAKVDDILAAIERADPTRARSPLRLWMRDNHDAFAARLKLKRPDWAGLARVFAERNLMDGKGQPPQAETARKTWQRVVAEVTRTRSQSEFAPPAVPPLELTLPASQPPMAAEIIKPAAAPRPIQRRTFLPSTPKRS